MRVYKIKNKEKFRKAKGFLHLLESQEKSNLEIIKKEITPFTWTRYLGYDTGFHLLNTYLGFYPDNELARIPEGWRFDKDYPKCLVPSKRYKKGKELGKKLDALPNYSFNKIEQVLGVNLISTGRFTIPKLIISKNKKYIFLITDDRSKMNKNDFKEVTQTYVNKKLGIKE